MRTAVILYVVMHITAGSVQDETLLQQQLLHNYSRNVRPDETTQVRVGLTAEHIVELDIVDQHMVFSGSLIVFWQDTRLSWNPANYHGTQEIFVKTSEIWKPLLVLKNSADDIFAVGDKGSHQSIPIQISSTGHVIWLAPAFLKSICAAKVALFPFDTQKCELLITNWLYPNEKVNISLLEGSVFLDRYSENGEYKLTKTYAYLKAQPSYGNVDWSILIFGFELQRRYSYYVINIVLPVLFLEALGVVVFFVPATSGEKLTYSLTLLLSLIVMTTIVAEQIPTTSISIPVLSIYVLEGVALAVLEVLVTVYILQLHSWHEEQRKPGKCHVFLTSLLTRCSFPNNKVSQKSEAAAQHDVIVVDASANGACNEPPMPTKLPHPAWTPEPGSEPEPEVTFGHVGAALERFCSWMFALLTVVFSLQALFTIVNG